REQTLRGGMGPMGARQAGRKAAGAPFARHLHEVRVLRPARAPTSAQEFRLMFHYQREAGAAAGRMKAATGLPWLGDALHPIEQPRGEADNFGHSRAVVPEPPMDIQSA